MGLHLHVPDTSLQLSGGLIPAVSYRGYLSPIKYCQIWKINRQSQLSHIEINSHQMSNIDINYSGHIQRIFNIETVRERFGEKIQGIICFALV